MGNKRYKATDKKGKFTFIDLIIFVFVLLVALWCISYYYDVFALNTGEKVKYNTHENAQATEVDQTVGKLYYTFVIDGIDYYEEEINLKDVNSISNHIYDKDKGEVISLKYEHYQEDKGSPYLKRLILNVAIPCTYKKGIGFFVNKTEFKIGISMPVKLKINNEFYDFNGYCSRFYDFVVSEEQNDD